VSSTRVIVIGGGASGLMAAGNAAAAGADVILLERMRQTGRKLRISGKGRCNLTNTAPTTEFLERFGRNGRFLHQALARFSPDDLVAFFSELGLATVAGRGGRVFPADGDAPAVADRLEAWALEKGVELVTGARVRGLDITADELSGLHYDLFSESGAAGSGGARGSRELEAKAIIVATGGKSYPSTGSSGDGYALAASAGHTIVEPRPALVPLKVAGGSPPGVAGLTLRNIEATLWVEGKRIMRTFGELQFTDSMLSGPVVLKMSAAAVDALRAGHNVELSVDLKPALDEKTLDKRLIRDLSQRQRPTWGDLVAGLLPRALRPVCLAACDVPASKPSDQVTSSERGRLRTWLKDVRFRVTGHGSFKEAIVTAGGVDLAEIDPRTMASRLLPGLYIVGELLDLNADTGGFNLQAAFSTGRVAGTAAASRVLGSADDSGGN